MHRLPRPNPPGLGSVSAVYWEGMMNETLYALSAITNNNKNAGWGG